MLQRDQPFYRRALKVGLVFWRQSLSSTGGPSFARTESQVQGRSYIKLLYIREGPSLPLSLY